MNNDLKELVTTYATSDHRQVITLLHNKSKDNVISILSDLLTHYFNDKNSSSLREFVLVSLAGFNPNFEKIGYNGYRQIGLGGQTEYCEAKPKNINTNESTSQGSPKKLNGGGNFTDYTWGRFQRDKEANPLMIIGGFLDGKLVYSLQFPFSTASFLACLQTQLKKRFPKGDISGEYLRSASFNIDDFRGLKRLKIQVFVDSNQLDQLKPFLTTKLYEILKKHLRESSNV